MRYVKLVRTWAVRYVKLVRTWATGQVTVGVLKDVARGSHSLLALGFLPFMRPLFAAPLTKETFTRYTGYFLFFANGSLVAHRAP